jgi:hypothetical protein
MPRITRARQLRFMRSRSAWMLHVESMVGEHFQFELPPEFNGALDRLRQLENDEDNGARWGELLTRPAR